ncbi:MAG: beta-glucosidase [Sphingobium sp.]
MRSVRTLMSGCALALLLATSAGARDVRTPDQRAEDTLSAMTFDEKVAMLHGNFGSVLRKTRPEEKRIGAGHVPGVARLGVPELFESDGALGIGNGGSMRPGDVATALPSALALGASFDPAIAYASGRMIGGEARAKGFNTLLAGGINLTRDAWAGRNFEYFGEDAWLSGVLGGESIRGIQSNGIIATVKHFALNAQETGRYVLDARIGEGALRESDLLAFQIAIERGQPHSVMCSYNKVNGDWACENAFLLTDVLRRDWGYKGWVMSDWGAVHSTVKAANAGLDQQSGQEMDAAIFFGDPLKAAVAKGDVSAATVDAKVLRILRSLYASGIADNPSPETPQPIDYAANAMVAQQAAEAGIVLLKNAGDVLPLTAQARRIVVIGGHADVGVLSGGGSSQVQAVAGSPLRLPLQGGPKNLSFIKQTYQGDAPLAAIRKRVRDGGTVAYLDGTDVAAAVAAARDADVVLVFAEQWRTEALDIESLSLPGGQDALIAAVAQANPRTAVVLQTGGAVLMPWLDKVPAVLEAWYPGERGGEAIARVLFGEVDASGRLPLTFPAQGEQMPRADIPGIANFRQAMAEEASRPPRQGATTIDITGGIKGFAVDYREGADVGYRWLERQGETPLFPFGHGLSYSRFAYSRLKLTGGERPSVSFRVTNVGKRAGSDVPQAYAAVEGDGAKRIRRLVGFQRVTLAPGASETVTLAIDPRLLARYDVAARHWAIRDAAIAFSIGTDARTMVLTGTTRVTTKPIRP